MQFKLTSLDGRPWHYKYDSEVRDLTKKYIWPPIFVWQCHSAGKRHHDHGKLPCRGHNHVVDIH